MKLKVLSLKNIKKSGKFLARLTHTHTHTHTHHKDINLLLSKDINQGINRITNEFYEQILAHKFGNLHEMN